MQCTHNTYTIPIGTDLINMHTISHHNFVESVITNFSFSDWFDFYIYNSHFVSFAIATLYWFFDSLNCVVQSSKNMFSAGIIFFIFNSYLLLFLLYLLCLRMCTIDIICNFFICFFFCWNLYKKINNNNNV